MKVLFIVPAYNEERSIVAVAHQIIEHGYDYVIVNDGSTDKTLDICRKNNLNLIDLPCNLGIGGAVQAGHLYARQHNYDIDVQFDGDGQHNITYAQDLINKIESGYDLAIGSRFLTQDDGFKSTFMRRVGIKWLSFLIGLLTKQKVTDPTSGFRAANSKAIDLFCREYPIDYPEPESIVEAHSNGLKSIETPVEMRAREEGKSSINAFSSIYYMIKVSLAILISAIGHNLKKRA